MLDGDQVAIASIIPSRERDRPDSLDLTGLPFNASFSYRYTESRSTTGSVSKNHTIGGTLEVSPTSKWRIEYDWYYDIADHQMASQNIEVYRDLHCWEAVFRWRPDGRTAGYYFLVNVKQLPEIKFEKSESGVSSSFR